MEVEEVLLTEYDFWEKSAGEVLAIVICFGESVDSKYCDSKKESALEFL